ncbi:MAG: DUF1801 domain-containing protein [Phycisphaerales bacterium]|nr:DUF1801 domain-containing protein [Phycisphaerales bacterium]
MATSKTQAETTPQPTAERRAAEARLRTLIAEYAPASARLIAAVRRSLRKRLPTAHEVVYEYPGAVVVSLSPSGRGFEGVLALRAEAEGVKLYLNRGKGLPDPSRLLKGSGTQARWIRLEAAATLARPEVAALIDAAIAGNQVPFEASGKGSVVVRTSSAKAAKKARPAKRESKKPARPAATRKRKSG